MKVLLVGFLCVAVSWCATVEFKRNDNSLKQIIRNSKVGEERDWWETAVFYQIYPRSFKDSNNDGIGDLQGIIQKLDHLKDAGITATWLSPIFKSPQVDQGYDISDYYTVDPDYGTNDDLKELLDKAHELGIKIILDFVPNHTSDQHQWFIDSVARKNGREDYYIWASGTTDETGERKPPNNWISEFKGSAWTWSEERQQFYLHQFASAQPDLNYRNNEVVQEMKNVLIHWLDFGVDGFRVDAVPFFFEDAQLLDEPRSNNTDANENDYEYLDHIYTVDQNETYDMIYDWRDLLDNYTATHEVETKIMMTEAYTTFENTLRYFGSQEEQRLGAHFSFNFDFITQLTNESTALDIFDIAVKWGFNMPIFGTFNWVLGNHDNHRAATRLGVEQIDGYNMLVAMLRGVAVTYNGEEIGQENGEVTCEEGKDPSAIKNCTTFDQVSRDFERTPFQWDDSVNAGFNDGAKPWLPVSKKANETNLASQNVNGTQSHYNVYKQLLEIRKNFKIIADMDTWSMDVRKNLLEVTRSLDTIYFTLLFNVSDDVVNATVARPVNQNYTVVVVSERSSFTVGEVISPEDITMNPRESIILFTLEQV